MEKDYRDIIIDFGSNNKSDNRNNTKYSKAKKGNIKIRKVILLDKNGIEHEFETTLDMAIYIKGRTGTTVSLDNIRTTMIKVAKGERKSAWGFVMVLIEGINY